MARCPRCGEPMNGGICDNCGFPMRRFRKIVLPVKKERDRILFYTSSGVY